MFPARFPLRYHLGVLVLVGAAACSGAQEQDVLSNQIGSSSATSSGNNNGSSGTTGQTTSGNTSGQTTSGTPGTTSGTPAGCAEEGDDSQERKRIELTSCAKGTLHPPLDDSDYLRYVRPKGAKMEIRYTGNVIVRIFDEDGNEHRLDNLPNREGEYFVQLDYDYDGHPLSGEDLKKGLAFEWSITISFTK